MDKAFVIHLTITGQDLGSSLEAFCADSENEYWYYFNEAETSKLISAIKGESDLRAALLREFNGEGGCRALREICEKNGIQYRFDSWVQHSTERGSYGSRPGFSINKAAHNQ